MCDLQEARQGAAIRLRQRVNAFLSHPALPGASGEGQTELAWPPAKQPSKELGRSQGGVLPLGVPMFGSEALNPMQPRLLLVASTDVELFDRVTHLGDSGLRNRSARCPRSSPGDLPAPPRTLTRLVRARARARQRRAQVAKRPPSVWAAQRSPAPLRSRRPTEKSGDRGLAAEAPAAGGGRVT